MPSPRLRALHDAVVAQASPVRAAGASRFFKTGKGEYGEGDQFIGLTVPQARKLARGARDLPIDDAIGLLQSKWHEERLLALLILVDAHQRGGPADRLRIHRAYLANTRYVNNWDLVDTSAAELVGRPVAENGDRLLDRLATSRSLWERRIAIIATLHCIKRSEFAPTLRIAERLLGDEHDLIHKAVGWMLRETGNRDPGVLRGFLEKHAAAMPRTALRYAIERLPAAERKRWLTARSERASSPRPRRYSTSRRRTSG